VCGRFARWTGIDDIEEFGDLRLPSYPFPSTYNAAPQSIQPIIRLSDRTGVPEIVPALWSFVPSWVKDLKTMAFSTFNARSEEIHLKNTFQESIQKNRRCLIPADCFYEWQTLAPKQKQPYAIGMSSGRAFAFAGLWNPWVSPDGTVVPTFTIATVTSNELMAPIHTRMPCIVEPDEYMRWLEPCDRPPFDLLRPHDTQKMRCWQVGKEVGNTRNDHPDLAKEIGVDAQLSIDFA